MYSVLRCSELVGVISDPQNAEYAASILYINPRTMNKKTTKLQKLCFKFSIYFQSKNIIFLFFHLFQIALHIIFRYYNN